MTQHRNDDDLIRIMTETHLADQELALLDDAAQRTYHLYAAYRDAGFSEEQAFRLVRDQLIAKVHTTEDEP